MKRFLSALLLTVMFACMLTGCGWTVPRPKIKKAEFHFSVTYEFNAEVKTVSGVYVCEYDGTSWTLDGGSHRKWVGHIQDGNVEDTIEIGTTEDGGTAKLVLALYPDYLMGDFKDIYQDAPKPYISVTLEDDAGMRIIHEPDDVEAYCGAKIISYEYPEPIENSFSLFN